MFCDSLRAASKLPDHPEQLSGVCANCGKIGKVQKDHLIEIQVWGEAACGWFHKMTTLEFLKLAQIVNSSENLQALCQSCNSSKGQLWKLLLLDPTKSFNGKYAHTIDKHRELVQRFGTVLDRYYDTDIPAATPMINHVLFQLHVIVRHLFPSMPPL
ncbi:unnamed protein product [Didymodactylos carnosus]|uniref:HNH endonuclease n=1 Tax=Didymodactylos carnosus TaxID=1234261 RepID=A0A815SSX8_9BILA|nr:unnamed protein product [Didymodactylos carnosus]CAF1494033.1 unnamed protein product [Didymodactylos carnosus]CAF4164853.1 unnamed protein product [Didymodactylos carnosus]CAF4356734.1 unnamed protein product [Didymodactylos carnosus]